MVALIRVCASWLFTKEITKESSCLLPKNITISVSKLQWGGPALGCLPRCLLFSRRAHGAGRYVLETLEKLFASARQQRFIVAVLVILAQLVPLQLRLLL